MVAWLARRLLMGMALAGLAVPVLADEVGTADDARIEACLAEARQAAPESGGHDRAAHDRRIMQAGQCICQRAADLCRGGMIQDTRLRQRVLDDK